MIVNSYYMNRFLLIAVIAGIFTVSSCKKDGLTPSSEGVDMEDIIVPSGFDWATTKAIKFNIGVTDTRFGNAAFTISIYDGNPSDGGHLISSGATTIIRAFTEKINIPSALKEIYITKTAPDGSVVTQIVKTGDSDVSVSFGQQNASTTISSVSGVNISADPEPVCDCGPNEQITSDWNTNIESAQNGKTYCVTQDGVSLTFNNNGSSSATFKICAKNVRFNAKLINNSQLIVTKGASVILGSNFNIGGFASFINYGTATFENGNVSLEGGTQFKNYGTVVFSGSFTTNARPVELVNMENATMRIHGKLTLDASKTGLNYGKIYADEVQINGSAAFENHCSLYIKGLFGVDKTITNYGFINVGYVLNENNPSNHDEGSGETRVNGSGIINLTGGALIQMKSVLTMDGKVYGTGDTSLFKTLSVQSFQNMNNNSGTFSGAVVYYAQNEPGKLKAEHFLNGAREIKNDNGLYIPQTDCNPGYGQAPEYFTYSVNYYNGGSTLIFEDKWPYKGDFDMNDLVISYKYRITKNSENKAIKLEGSYTLLASGGDIESGFGLKLPVDFSNAVLLSKNRDGIQLTNDGQKALLTLFNSARRVQANWNTVIGDPVSDTVTYNFVLKFNTPVELDNGAYNPFIFNTTGGVRHEVHLPGADGTSLAGTILGIGDNSATQNYITKDNLPWAMNVPVASFKYPIERTSISKAYPLIKNWAQSAGNEENQWYNQGTASLCYPVK